MSDTSYLFHKILHETKIADRQRELAAQRLARRNRKQRWDSVRLAAARGLHRLAGAIEPGSALRVPAQRRAA
ncbi:hypothetical protein [Tenggerimyces flavus]|uniref:Uncharacterized protein n=1 Tax=Tenggerimyces flavus TaxID=1708749 RepID=A0ABV7YJT4_9ACTN|nr:hypothetical protein [Tenggerimyces flavus]MBM7784129.1 hypothetical protein [Tenggerimyces flavus]